MRTHGTVGFAAVLLALLVGAPLLADDHKKKPPPPPPPPPKTTTTAPQPVDTTTTTIPTPIVTLPTLPLPTTTLPDPPDTTTTTMPPPVTTTLPAPPVTTTTIPAGGCVPGTSTSCQDGNVCTIDVCDLMFGCFHTPVTGTNCDDGDPCTTDDRCERGRCVGTPMDCDDDASCTDDACVAGKCVHTPVDARCDRGACRISSCRPNDPGADGKGCVDRPVTAASKTPKDKGRDDAPRHDDAASADDDPVCTDDGFSCTDDVCGPDGCQHVPVDSRCVPAGQCTSAVCAPEDPAHDDAGCAPGPPRNEGEECAEDGDACTLDVCRGGGCAHEPIEGSAACAPVQGAFRQTMALDGMARGIAASAVAAGAPSLGEQLANVAGTLADASRVLSGKDTPAPALAGGTGRAAAIAPTSALDRAHIAFTMVLRTPRQVSAFLETVALARTRAAIGQPAARDLRQRGRLLLRGTKTLKANLKRLQKSAASTR